MIYQIKLLNVIVKIIYYQSNKVQQKEKKILPVKTELIKREKQREIMRKIYYEQWMGGMWVQGEL